MKHNLRYRFITIPNKLMADIRISVDDKQTEFNSVYDGGKSSALMLFPFIALQILKFNEVDENGRRSRQQWNPNDTLTMTRYNYPILIRELTAIMNDMKIPEMYSYTGSRLDVNVEAAEKARRVFMISNATLELVPIVIEQQDESRVEGIKMKFNNEQSVVALTLNELDSLLYQMNHTDIENLAINLYNRFASDGSVSDIDMNKQPIVDIQPKGL